MKALIKMIGTYVIAMLIILPSAVLADDMMTVIANSKDQESAQRWIDYLVSNEIMVDVIIPKYFGSNSDSDYLVIMGGVDNAVVKKILIDLIGADEVAAMSKKGAAKMYLIKDKYAIDQKILVYTGSDSQAAIKARIESKEEWMPMLEAWFDLEEGPSGLKAY